MKFVVVLVALAAICYADDDDDSDEVMTFSEVRMTPLIPQVRSLSNPIPSHVPLVQTLPAATLKTAANTIVHGQSSVPAVMRIPTPGIKFDIPATQGIALPVERTIHAPATIQAPAPTVKVETPVPTLRTGVSIVHSQSSSPAVTKISKPDVKFQVPAAPESSLFQHFRALPLPYYSNNMNFGVPLPGLAPQTAHATPVQYTSSAPAAVATPVHPTVLQAAPQGMTYWRDIVSPQQMANFVDVNTGGFSYINVLGNTAFSRSTPLVLSHPFKGIQSFFPVAAGVKGSHALIAA
ncbi:uncharacterized protein [Palaemon carinicauda]|uniref:uncharacterized protein n=1 Tax=Palaemon carinicauda TaxID=392227 RepID=UPI0035B5B7E1